MKYKSHSSILSISCALLLINIQFHNSFHTLFLLGKVILNPPILWLAPSTQWARKTLIGKIKISRILPDAASESEWAFLQGTKLSKWPRLSACSGNDLLINRLIDCLIDWLVYWLINGLIDCLVNWLLWRLVGWLADSMINWLIDWIKNLRVQSISTDDHSGLNLPW